MQRFGDVRGKPLTAAVVAVVLAFAVVCPLMAAPGVPAEQGCHGGSEGTPDAERVSVCCSSVTVPKLLTPEPGPAVVLPAALDAAPAVPARNHETEARLPSRQPDPPLFVQHAALLI